MKTVYPSHSALAEAWAKNELAPEGHEFRSSNMLATHESIYSYGWHFCIARKYEGLFLFTERNYSNSTAKHKSKVLHAIGYGEALHVPELDGYGGPANSAPGWIASKLDAAALQFAAAKRARQNKPCCLGSVIRLLNTAANLAEVFKAKLPTRPDWLDTFLDVAVVEVFKAKCDNSLSDWRWQNADLANISLHPCYGVTLPLGEQSIAMAA